MGCPWNFVAIGPIGLVNGFLPGPGKSSSYNHELMFIDVTVHLDGLGLT